MAIPIIRNWKSYYPIANEGLGSSYERIVLNNLLLKLYKINRYKTVIESPCFGFTGISGINLVALAQKGCKVILEDHDLDRIELVGETWGQLSLPVELHFNLDYCKLDYPDKSIDFGFNFSALWFVSDLPIFLSELCRVVRKQILICVPNRDGIGFKGQLRGYSKELYPNLHPENIDPHSIIWLMRKLGWSLVEENYIDCPPWPDIGMNKEEYLKQIMGKKIVEPSPKSNLINAKSISIMPYYLGEDLSFANRMLRFGFLENNAPKFFKRIWAHHHYYLFSP